MKAVLGDKVRLKVAPHNGLRGELAFLDGDRLVVRLDGSEQRISVSADQITNFSLAARKAWETEPDRAVGRRKRTKLSDRVSVTLRLDRHLWERFLSLEEAGVIENRTSLINEWLREKLAGLEGGGRQS